MALTKNELISTLLQLNNAENPFRVTNEGDKVTATWNIVDAKWLQIFAEAGMKDTYEIVITLDEAKHEISYVEHQGTVTWEAGVPRTQFQTSMFSGKSTRRHVGVAFGVRTDLSVGKLYQFDFDTKKIKQPVFTIIEQSGWVIKRSFIAKLLGM